jgi:hypothetical protein
MLKSLLRMTRSLLFAGAACAAVPSASAVDLSFENPPYTPGNVLGQDGWSATGYFPTLNGTVEISSTSPLAGSQSLSYTRTEAGLAPNGADVVKADVVTVFKDGTPAVDLNATFLISSTSLSAQGMGFGIDGLFLSPAGASGATPIGIRLTNAGSTIPSVEIYADNGGSAAFFYFGGSLAAAAFPENDTLEFSIDVDFDSSTYNVAYRNVTTGSPFVDSGSVRGFASSYTANANGTYDVDVIAAFRYGAGRIDNIRLTGNIVPEPAAAGLAGLTVGAAAAYRRRRRKIFASRN